VLLILKELSIYINYVQVVNTIIVNLTEIMIFMKTNNCFVNGTEQLKDSKLFHK